MSFEIHDHEGNAIHLVQLDVEASQFWDVEVHNNAYVHPPLDKYYTNSWFDSIGFAISSPEGYASKEHPWDDVKCTLWTIQARAMYKLLYKEEFITELNTTRIFLKPYFDLIDHWQSKGYIPIKIK